MATFQKIILFGAIIILIIALVFIGISLTYSKDQNWPPMTPECPDYWLADLSNNVTSCINIKDLGSCPAQNGKKHLTMDFNTGVYAGENGDCAKYTWAKKCGISWDGITYGVNNPCQTAS